jgi:hypothetical protein
MATRRTDNAHWTDAHEAVLIYGKDFFPRGWPWAGGVHRRRRFPESVPPAADISPAILEDMRAAWAHFGPAIMRTWDSPGKRPFSWWLFNSPEPRDNALTQSRQLLLMNALSEQEKKRLSANDS